MAYVNATYYMDYSLGSDTVRSALANCNMVNNGSGAVRVQKVGHGLVTGAVVTVPSGTYSGDWLINRINADNFDLCIQRAFGIMTISGIPVVNETFVIGGQTFTFKALRTGAGEVTISADNEIQCRNIEVAITTDIGATILAMYDPIVTQKTPPMIISHRVRIVNLIGGTAGNSTVFTEAATGIAITGSGTLASGQDSTYSADRLAVSITPFGGMNWTDAWQTITTGVTAARIAPGDIVRIAKSADPVSLGINGTFTNAPVTLPTAKNIVSSTNASPINILATGHGYITGDVVYIQDHAVNLPANGNWIVTRVDANNFTLDGSTGIGVGGATGTITLVNHQAVKLSAATTKTINRCQQAWTGGASCTVTLDTADYKEGDASLKIVTGNLVAGQLLAYFNIATLNLASYQQITFWIKNSTTALATGDLQIKLCSDDVGAVPVNTVNVPAISSTARWIPITVDTGGALGNAIESIAVYSTIAMNAKTFFFNNFVASNSSGISMQSLISKNSATQHGTEGFYGIQSISEDGKVIRLDNDVNTLGNVVARGQGYTGTTETVALYKRETIKTTMGTVAATQIQAVQDSGTYALGNIQFQGGYNISTNIQDGETFFDGLNGLGYGLYGNTTYITYNLLNFHRYTAGYYSSTGASNQFIIAFNNLNNNTYGFYSYNHNTVIIKISNACNNANNGVSFNASGNIFVGALLALNNNIVYGLSLSPSSNNRFGLVYCSNNGGRGISFDGCSLNSFNYVFTGNNLYNSIILSNSSQKNYIKQFIFNETTPISTGPLDNAQLFIGDYNGAGTKYIATDYGSIVPQVSTLANGSGIEWLMSVTNAIRSYNYVLPFSISKIACNANNSVTVKIWVKKSHATNIAAALVVRGGQIAGVDTDVITVAPSNTNENQLTLTFTPTAIGIVQVEMWLWYVDNTGSVIVDAMTITQGGTPLSLPTMDYTYLGEPFVTNSGGVAGGVGLLVHPGYQGGYR